MDSGFLASFTRLSKGLAAILVATFLISLIFPSLVTYFALVPGRTIPFAWNLVTAGFVERSLLNLVADVVALLVLARLLEPAWGTKEFLRFVVIVSTVTSACTFVSMIVVYIFTLQESIPFTPISGFQGVVAGLLVALKQTTPEQDVPFLPLRLRIKWVPSLAVAAALVGAVLLGQVLLYFPFVLFGTYSAWVYLRFFQPRGGEGALKGDPSDDFAFATFFPEPLQPTVGRLVTVLGRIFCGRRLERGQQMAESEMLAAGLPLPGSHPVEASRRRERGARALEERLSKTVDGAPSAAAGSVPPPSDAAAPDAPVPPPVADSV